MKGEASLRVGKREGIEHCPRRQESERKGEKGKKGLTRGSEVSRTPLYICLVLCYTLLRNRFADEVIRYRLILKMRPVSTVAKLRLISR